jgi:uncharacterized membrane protein YbhN (UPF0104 family)
VVFYALLIGFLAYYLATKVDYDLLFSIRFNWWFILVACVTGLTSRYWGAFIWIAILRTLGAKNARYSPPLIGVYAKSWLGRYIPGTAPWILGKIYFAAREGISRNKLAVSSLLEAALQIVVQLALALALLLFDTRADATIEPAFKVLMVLVLLGCIVAIVPPVFNRLMALAYRVLRRGKFEREHYATWRTIGTGAGLYVVGSLINGVSLYFIAKATYPELGYDLMPFVIGVATLAGVSGMLAVFAPGGLGVREGIQALLFVLVMPAEIALAVVVVSRIWSVAMDLIFFGSAWLLNRFRGGRIPEIAPPVVPGIE